MLLTVPDKLVLMLRLLPTLFLMSLLSPSSVSGSCSRTMLCRPSKKAHLYAIIKLITFSTLSIEGFWAHGLGKEGTLRVGDDDEGA